MTLGNESQPNVGHQARSLKIQVCEQESVNLTAVQLQWSHNVQIHCQCPDANLGSHALSVPENSNPEHDVFFKEIL